MNNKFHIFLAYLIMAILLSNCNNKRKTAPTKVTNNNTLSIKVELPSSGEAIKHIQTHAARKQQTVMVPTYYYKNVSRKKPCNQYDYDLGKCTGANSGSKYGYKMVMQKERTCCQSKPKLVSKIKGNWVATYIEPKKEWEVTLEYNDDSKKKQKASWSISLSKSNGLQVSFGG